MAEPRGYREGEGDEHHGSAVVVFYLGTMDTHGEPRIPKLGQQLWCTAASERGV